MYEFLILADQCNTKIFEIVNKDEIFEKTNQTKNNTEEFITILINENKTLKEKLNELTLQKTTENKGIKKFKSMSKPKYKSMDTYL